LKDVYIRKAKILRRPKFDAFKLAELHTASAQSEDKGTPVEQGEGAAAGTPVVGTEAPVVAAGTKQSGAGGAGGAKTGKSGGKSGGAKGGGKGK